MTFATVTSDAVPPSVVVVTMIEFGALAVEEYH